MITGSQRLIGLRMQRGEPEVSRRLGREQAIGRRRDLGRGRVAGLGAAYGLPVGLELGRDAPRIEGAGQRRDRSGRLRAATGQRRCDADDEHQRGAQAHETAVEGRSVAKTRRSRRHAAQQYVADR